MEKSISFSISISNPASIIVLKIPIAARLTPRGSFEPVGRFSFYPSE